MRRGQLISLSAQGMRVQELLTTPHLHEEYVRQLLRQYNEEGLGSPSQASPSGPSGADPGRPSVVVEIATMPLGPSGSLQSVSLRKLTDHLVGRQMICKVSHVTIGKVLDRHEVAYQRTRIWKESTDPDFAGEERIDRLYQQTPSASVVVCLTEGREGRVEAG